MKLSLLWVGRTRDKNLSAAIELYLERIRRQATVEVLEVREEAAADRHSEAAALLKEGRRLLERLPAGYEVVILDEGGRQLSSDEFAGFLRKRSSAPSKGLAFVIGGHLGLDREIRQAADHTISLSRMTLTHEMARLVAVEQIYRGLSIISGSKYHRP